MRGKVAKRLRTAVAQVRPRNMTSRTFLKQLKKHWKSLSHKEKGGLKNVG